MFDFNRFQEFAFSNYPSLKERAEKFYPSFFSPFKIEVSQNNFLQIKNFIKASFELRDNKDYQNLIRPMLKGFDNFRHYSVLMSYDFHLTEDGPKLIEINTNAGFFLGLDLLTRFHESELGLKNSYSNARLELFKSFENEHLLNTNNKITNANLAIVDQKLESQDLYCEFLMYRDFFKSKSVNAEIADVVDLLSKEDGVYSQNMRLDFIYNRHTDFFLESPELGKLKESLVRNSTQLTLSPHPREYALLASKNRIHEWQQAGFLEKLGLGHLKESLLNCLISSYNVQNTDAEKLWTERKNLFFKPMESFGSKAAYAGRGITKKVFDHILSHNYLAQALTPAPQFVAEDKTAYKYDLRVYVYKDQIQQIGARLYQGQTTNFKTPRGGFAPVTVI